MLAEGTSASSNGIDNSPPDPTYSTISSAQTTSAPRPQSENAGPYWNEEAGSSDVAVLGNLASFSAILEYLFSFVKERPTSTLGLSQFSFIAAFITGSVVLIGIPLYCSLLFINLRRHTWPRRQALPTNSINTTLSSLQTQGPDVSSIIKDMVRPDSKNHRHPDDDLTCAHNLPVEILAFATDIAEARTYALKDDLMLKIEEGIDTNRSDCERMSKQDNDLQRSLREEFNHAIKGHESQILKAKEELDSAVQSRLDSLVSQFCSRLDSKLNSLDSQVESKLDSILESKIGHKLDSQVKADLVSGQLSLNAVRKNLSELRDTMAKTQENVDVVTKEMMAKVSLEDFSRTKDNMMETMMEVQSKLGALANQLPAKAAIEDLDGLKQVITTARSELKFLADQIDTKVAPERFNDVESVLTTVRLDLNTLAKQIRALVTVEDFSAMKTVVAMAQAELKSVAEQATAKVALEDFNKMKDTIAMARSDLDSLTEQVSAKATVEDPRATKDKIYEAEPVGGSRAEEPVTEKVDPEAAVEGAAETVKSCFAPGLQLPPASTTMSLSPCLSTPATADERSTLHVPKISFDREAAAQGRAEMFKSRYARQQQSPGSPSITNRKATEKQADSYVPKVKSDPKSAAQGKAELFKSRYASQ